MNFPRSPYDATLGLIYFARMLDKIRRVEAGTLPVDYQPFIGDGFDGRMCRYLEIQYEDVKARTLQGGEDGEILEWVYENGRRLSDEDVTIWNKYAGKFGWRDDDTGASARLELNKERSGLKDRADIVTFFDFYDVDEGRKP